MATLSFQRGGGFDRSLHIFLGVVVSRWVRNHSRGGRGTREDLARWREGRARRGAYEERPLSSMGIFM